jgi:two-component system chemotaxis sensor kinase CheA
MELSKDEMMEIMAVFKGESAEHLDTLTAKMKDIEKNPANLSAIELLHRTSHSMKGAARMMGLTPIEQIGKALEDGFKMAKEGKPVITPETMAIINDAIEGLRKLIDQLAAQGTVEGFDVSGILSKLEKFK